MKISQEEAVFCYWSCPFWNNFYLSWIVKPMIGLISMDIFRHFYLWLLFKQKLSLKCSYWLSYSVTLWGATTVAAKETSLSSEVSRLSENASAGLKSVEKFDRLSFKTQLKIWIFMAIYHT